MIIYPPRAPGSTDQRVYFRAAQSSTGANPGDPITVTSATPGISLSYRRQGAAPVPISLSNLSALTDPYSSGGLLVVGAGLHRLDVPNAAFASGSDDVVIFGSATDIVIFGALVPLGVPTDSIDASALTANALAAIQNEVVTALVTEDIATDGDVAAVGTAVSSVDSAVAALDSEVTQLAAALLQTQYPVPGQQTPPTTPTLPEMQVYTYKALVHAIQQTASEFRLMNRAGTQVDQKAAASDDGTTFTRGSLMSGP